MRDRIGTAVDAGRAGVESAVRRLCRELHGPLHRPGDAGYDAGRRTIDPSFEARPALVVEALGAADVRAAVVAAREHDLPFAVQATGHGTRVPCDGGILVRTGAMATVLVDPDRRVAHVGAGARWGDVLAAAAPFGLAPLSGSSPDVGVAGYTLGGGLGWLARRHGFAADSLLRAEVVTAEGGLVTASAEEHPDLLWALRGGGGSFGVVTAMELRLHPVDRVYAGTAFFAIERGGAARAGRRAGRPPVGDAVGDRRRGRARPRRGARAARHRRLVPELPRRHDADPGGVHDRQPPAPARRQARLRLRRGLPDRPRDRGGAGAEQRRGRAPALVSGRAAYASARVFDHSALWMRLAAW
jgi:FAD/FMN-containing dehydrogenase